jgi:hypothetical protein
MFDSNNLTFEWGYLGEILWNTSFKEFFYTRETSSDISSFLRNSS